jgi:hypothetical protein
MAFFGKKKEVKLEDIPIPEELKPHLELRKDEESQFTSPEDFAKMTIEQINPNYAQPQQITQTVQPETQMKVDAPQVIAQPVTQMPQVSMQHTQEKSGFAPLFVKIDRYRNILKSLGELKTMLALMKNAFVMLDRIDKMEDENMNLILNSLDKIEKKLIALDSEFLRPSGFEDETSDMYEFENVQGVISDLHSQIQKLKGDMEQVQ